MVFIVWSSVIIQFMNFTETLLFLKIVKSLKKQIWQILARGRERYVFLLIYKYTYVFPN